MLDEGYSKPAMVEDPEPEIEADDQDEEQHSNIINHSNSMFQNHENQLLYSSVQINYFVFGRPYRHFR